MPVWGWNRWRHDCDGSHPERGGQASDQASKRAPDRRRLLRPDTSLERHRNRGSFENRVTNEEHGTRLATAPDGPPAHSQFGNAGRARSRIEGVSLPLIDYLALRVRDLRRSRSFYEHPRAVRSEGTGELAGSRVRHRGRRRFLDRGRGAPGRSVHVAFAAADRATVDSSTEPLSKPVAATTARRVFALSTTPGITLRSSSTRIDASTLNQDQVPRLRSTERVRFALRRRVLSPGVWCSRGEVEGSGVLCDGGSGGPAGLCLSRCVSVSWRVDAILSCREDGGSEDPESREHDAELAASDDADRGRSGRRRWRCGTVSRWPISPKKSPGPSASRIVRRRSPRRRRRR